MDETTSNVIIETWELFLIGALLVLVLGGILYMSNLDHLQAKARAAEVSYIATLINNNNVVVELNYKDTTLQENQNKIQVKYDDITLNTNYYGKPISIEKQSEGKYTIKSS